MSYTNLEAERCPAAGAAGTAGTEHEMVIQKKETGEVHGHLAALFTILVWGTTYISTKVLLRDFNPVEILMIRFVIGYGVLWILYPHRIRYKNIREELTFLLAGLSGMTIYYLLENIALQYTMASNIGVLITVAPFFTAILSKLLGLQGEKTSVWFYIGFAISMTGLCLLSFGGAGVQLHLFGDFLGLCAALSWAVYSVLSKKITAYGYNTAGVTRRIFAYGILFMIPAMAVFHFDPPLQKLKDPVILANILYLGIVASAICFVVWNLAVRLIGVVKTSVYIYLTPVVTVISSVLILHERITPAAGIGIVMALAGLILSNRK